MRSRVLTPAIAAVISLLALTPVNAFAHKHPSPSGRCAVSINVVPPHMVAGGQVVIFGRLRCVNPAAEANQPVMLFHHLAGAPGFTFIQRTTTDAHGFYVFYRADGVVETNRSWYVLAHGARSAAKRIHVEAQVMLNGPTEGQLLTGFANRVTFSGTVSPADAQARVILQRQNSATGGEWHRIDSGVVGADGSFSIVHTFVVPGDANIRVLVRSQGRNVPSVSSVLAYVVSQTQNPQLTIQASTDPIAFGQTTTISGKLASGDVEAVTLMERTARQSGFAPIAQTTTNSAGEYSFPAQSPVNSTFYRVVSSMQPCEAGGRRVERRHCKTSRISSAVLYEGVKDVLTAQVSATTVQAGQSVTFSGTVAPDHTSHVIYLERQDAHGPGFHVIQVAFVGAGSSYSIAHQLYDPGSKVLRVYIPGGPDNQGAASAPFTIQVTPAPAAALMPEAPNNSSAPPEGQV